MVSILLLSIANLNCLFVAQVHIWSLWVCIFVHLPVWAGMSSGTKHVVKHGAFSLLWSCCRFKNGKVVFSVKVTSCSQCLCYICFLNKDMYWIKLMCTLHCSIKWFYPWYCVVSHFCINKGVLTFLSTPVFNKNKWPRPISVF